MPKGTCLFCTRTDLSETHIWPEWLYKLIPPAPRGPRGRHSTLIQLDHPQNLSPTEIRIQTQLKQKQGSFFRFRPKLACQKCNNEWMNDFENEMVTFSKPLFISNESVFLNETQLRSLVGWISLITILAEHIDKKTSLCISGDEMSFFKKYRVPPDTWSIFVATLDASEWTAKYRHHASYQFPSALLPSRLVAAPHNNSQISSFGLGKIFFQVCSTPVYKHVTDYQVAASAKGLLRLWPLPFSIGFWPFPRPSAKFPTKLILDDTEADILADFWKERLEVMTGPKSLSRFRPG